MPAELQQIIAKFLPVGKENTTIGDIIDRQLSFYDGYQTYRELRKMVDEGLNDGKYTLKSKNGLNFNEALKDSALQKTFIDFVTDSTA